MKILRLNYVKYGLIMSCVLLICLVLMHVTGQYDSFEKGAPLDILFVIAPFILWFLGLRSYKKMLNDRMTFKQGLFEGIRISVVFAVFSSVIFATYYLFVNQAIIEYLRKSYGMEEASNTAVIITDLSVQFIGSITMGTIFTSILSFFMKTKK